MSIVFRPVRPGDRPALLHLFKLSFGAEPSLDEWIWKYDRNPRRSISVGAFDGEKAVGFFGGIGTRYRGADGDLPGTSSVDVMTDPAVRSLGKQSFFKELGETYRRLNAEIGIPFDFGFPHERARKIEERLLGCVTIERAGQLARPVDGLGGRRGSGRLLRRARVDEPFGAAHRSLAEALHARAGWRTDRSDDVLGWRFSGRPSVSYRSVQLVGLGGGSLGYAVVRVTGDAALLVDLQLRNETSPALGDLLAEVGELARAAGSEIRTLRVRLPQGSPLAARLAGEFSFAPEESDTVFLVRSLFPEFDLLPAARHFDYRYADHDVF